MSLIYYYVKNEKVVYMTDENDEIKEMDIINIQCKGIRKFRLLDGYDSEYEALRRFKKDFNEWCDNLKTVAIKTKTGKYYRLDYKKYYSHKDAVFRFWKKFVDKDVLKKFEDIKDKEFYIIERCGNGGLITLNLNYKEKITQCYGNDFSSFYPNLMKDMQIPYKQGKILNLESVTFGKLKYGIYRVKITYEKEEFTNIFNFSKLNHYTSTILNSIFKYKDLFGLKFKLLEADDEYDYNALTYEYSDLTHGKTLFSEWLNTLLKLKKEIPKNRLLKHLLSTLHGTLNSFKKMEIDKNLSEDYDCSHIHDADKSEYKILGFNENGNYKCVKSSEAYNYNFARLKAFLPSFGRKRMFEFVIKHDVLNNIIAIHTDRMALNKNIDFSKLCEYYPLPEKKSTGKIIFHNSINYSHICQKCNEQYLYKNGCKKCITSSC